MKNGKIIQLSDFGIVRPDRIRWMYPNDIDVLSSIKSKSTRCFLRKSGQALREYGISSRHEVLTEAGYEAWLPYYEKKMSEAGYDIFAKTEWYAEKIAEGKVVEAIFFYTSGQLCGSIIYTTKEGQRADACFKASDQIEGLSKKRQSLGAIIDYYFLVDVTKRAFPLVSMGRSRNAFGVINKIGYLDYKLRFGCRPMVEPGFPLHETVPVTEDGYVVFFGLRGGELSLFSFTAKSNPQTFDLARFNSESLKYEGVQY